MTPKFESIEKKNMMRVITIIIIGRGKYSPFYQMLYTHINKCIGKC